ncbi:cytochrome c1 [Pelagibius marinus]|uniref:cytochrome c1 n=1 Tax=Pelagibius marinus TaxID=2762760 RepID=UPI0018722FCE|nr:cytochrome c1 [Pelagibius marinus]
MRKGLIFGLAALAAIATASSAARAAEEGPALPHVEWSFDGPFGTFDRHAMQRGLQVYREVCSACHSLNYIAFRDLAALGYDEDEIKAIAAEYTVTDGPNDEGEMFEREGRPSDYFPAPFPNEKAAAASNGGAAPPDLSLMAKARVGGPTYIYGLLTGYEDPPAGFPGDNYNLYFPGHQIAMAPPLFEDGVSYADGTPATVEQMAKDVSHFLMWTAEPKLEDRKGMGIKVLIFLVVFTGVLYAAKRKIWADVH